MALRASFLFLAALGACTTTASTSETSAVTGPLTVDLSWQLTPLNTCAGGAAGVVRVQPVEPRGDNLLLVQASELLAAKGTTSQVEVLLRPPGACGLLSPCGHLLVRIDQAAPFVVATRTFEVPLAGLAQIEGAHTIEVKFLGDDGEQAIDPKGQPLGLSLPIEIVASGACP